MAGTSYQKMHYERFLDQKAGMTLKYLPSISSIWAQPDGFFRSGNIQLITTSENERRL
jgi:hypothetical protein